MLMRLRRFSPECFWGAKPTKVASLIRDSLFCELSIFWQTFKPDSLIHSVHTNWEFLSFPRLCHNRYGSTLLHSSILNRAPCRAFLYRCNKVDDDLCRFGCQCTEDIVHFLFHCPGNEKERNQLKTLSQNNNISFSVKEVFSNYKMQIEVEKFLINIFDAP